MMIITIARKEHKTIVHFNIGEEDAPRPLCKRAAKTAQFTKNTLEMTCGNCETRLIEAARVTAGFIPRKGAPFRKLNDHICAE